MWWGVSDDSWRLGIGCGAVSAVLLYLFLTWLFRDQNH
jgi:hypothetical protein